MRQSSLRFYLACAACLASLFFVRIGFAADLPVAPPITHTISGFIDSKTLAGILRLLPAAKANGALTLYLDSPGGQMGSANRIAGMVNYLERHGVRTRAHVGRDRQCLSACVIILAASDRRTVAPSAWIGLHGPYSARSGELNRPAADRMIAYFQRQGVSQAWLAKLKSDGVFDRHELTSFDVAGLLPPGLVHEITVR